MPLRIFACILGPGALLAAGLFALSGGGPILIESRESKTTEGKPVYNRIFRTQSGSQDIWLMQQSHHGLAPAPSAWDRLAIVVDKDNRTARFYQLAPGELAWTGMEHAIPNRVACFLCHANGPRAIRPNLTSISWRDRLSLFAWNLRIKTYGRLTSLPALAASPFRIAGAYASEPLPVKKCALCHNDHAWGRGRLLRQHFLPIRFLLKEGQMPPPGIPISGAERREVEEFLKDLD